MTRSYGRWLPRVVGEFLVIVIGVLVAFQFENWRIARDDSRREFEQLQALHADFVENRSRLAETIERHEMVVARGERLLYIMDQGASVPADSIPDLLYGALAFFQAELVTGAYDALINSGDISLISNPILLRHLANFHGELASGFEDHDNSVNLLHSLEVEMSPYLADLSPWRGYVDLPPADPSDAAARMLQNTRIEGLLFMKTLMEQNRLGRLRLLAAQVDTVLDLVTTELGG
jgi:hypothetical protein